MLAVLLNNTGAADNAPTIPIRYVDDTRANGHTYRVGTDIDATVYGVRIAGADTVAPSGPQIVAGTDSADAAALESLSLVVTGGSNTEAANSMAFVTANANTDYRHYFVAVATAGGLLSTVSAAPLVTTLTQATPNLVLRFVEFTRSNGHTYRLTADADSTIYGIRLASDNNDAVTPDQVIAGTDAADVDALEALSIPVRANINLSTENRMFFTTAVPNTGYRYRFVAVAAGVKGAVYVGALVTTATDTAAVWSGTNTGSGASGVVVTGTLSVIDQDGII